MKTSLIAFLILALGVCGFRAEALSWANYTVDTPPGAVYALRQSTAGPVWVGSGQGLALFDGFRARAVRDASGRPFAAQVYALVENPDGSLWLGTNNGLFCYEPARNMVLPVEGSFPNEIRAMIADAAGRLWIGSLEGLFVFDPADGANITDLSAMLPHRAVYALLHSKTDGCIYAGTYDGLCRFVRGNMRPEPVSLAEARGPQANIFVNALADDPSTGEIFIGMEGALLVYTPATEALRAVKAVDGNSVKSLALSGRFLAAGTDNGLYVVDRAGAAECARHDSRRPSSIADNVIWTLMTDAEGNLWAGTGVGLSIAGGDSAVREISLADITASGEGQTIYSIFRDTRRRLWMGGSNGLILAPDALMPAAEASAVRWHAQSSERFPLPHNRVRALAETSDGRLLMAGDGGLNVLDEATGRFRRLRLVDASHTRNANWAYALAEDSAARSLWVGGYLGGVFRMPLSALDAPDGAVCVADTALTAENHALASNLINNIVRDSSGNLWVLLYREGAVERITADGSRSSIDIVEATGGWPTLIVADTDGDGGVWVGFDGGGVVRIDSLGVPAAPIRIGRPHNPSGILYAMAPVGRELWVATGDGVHAVDCTTGRSRLLPLPPRTYTSLYYDALTGTVLLGSTDAIVQVDPLRLASRRRSTPVSVVGAFIGDTPVDAAAHVMLPYGSGALTLELATFDYSPDAFERFAYRCSPDTLWTLLPPRDNRLVLSGLTVGKHTLELRLGDDPSSMRSLSVEVLPPWYLSPGWRIVWAILMLALGLAAFLIARGHNKRNLRRIERRNALAKAEERLNFITNVSHDLKTPLSMIIGPLSRVRDGSATSADEKERAVETAFENAMRLHRLLAHTLEASALDATTDSAAVTRPTDISALVRKLVENCASAYPDCSFAIHTPEGEALIADVDEGKFESVVSNLLSNAIKYSPTGAAEISVDLSVDAAKGAFRLSVADKGIGIVADRIPHIFERKYRTPRGADFSEGSGIGLYLVKHFVELHGGTVSVESEPGRGSVFAVEMPLKAAAGVLEPTAAPGSRAAIPLPDPSRRRVLIVDDNDEVLTFIGTILEPAFQCAFASDGARALEIAPVFRPDLIITDEKMPGMSGLEMVRALKSTPATASISVILLTAMASNELESRSIAAGVDLFMSKPFDPAMLRVRAESILRRKAEIRRAARIEEITAAAPPEGEEVSESERTLARVAAVVESNIASPVLSVAFVCEQTGLQPKQLYRLMKKNVGVTPVEYIRNMRLDRAAALLAKGGLTVSEVMYRIGFNSPSYFSKCFRARFGTAPAEYKE